MLRWQKWVVGASFISVVAAVVFFCVFYKPLGVVATINKQLAALYEGDILRAYSYTSKDFRNITPYADFEDFVEQYPALKSNKGLTVSSQIINDDGTNEIKGLISSSQSQPLGIEFQMVQENDQWKVLGIEISPILGTNKKTIAHTKEFDNSQSKYKVHYPSSWVYENPGVGTVIFSGRKGAPSFYTTVNIQTVLTKKTGGDFSTVKQFMQDIKQQTLKLSNKTKVLDQGSISIIEAGGQEDVGQYIVFTYFYMGEEFKQWQIVFLRSDNGVFYAWAYTAPVALYDDYIDVAKEMLKSWVIY